MFKIFLVVIGSPIMGYMRAAVGIIGDTSGLLHLYY